MVGFSEAEIIRFVAERVYIYGLINPITEEMFYIGQTAHPYHRLSNHIGVALNKTGQGYYYNFNNPRLKLIRDIVASDHYPIMVLLCVLPKWDTVFEEKVIKHFRSLGYPLTNGPKYHKKVGQ